MTDFNAIFRTETDAEKQASAQTSEVNQVSQALYGALNRGDYLAAGKSLQKAGSCQWQDILKGDGTNSIANGTKFPAHFSLEKDKTSVEIFERIVSTSRRSNTLVPRLTVTDESCEKKLKK
ncbi:hypothetical protein BH11CYA1_BH11CYA1_39390 [soil metagenome]